MSKSKFGREGFRISCKQTTASSDPNLPNASSSSHLLRCAASSIVFQIYSHFCSSKPTKRFARSLPELSSDSGHQPQTSVHDLVSEVREMRLSLLMEIEKRKQAKDSLNIMQHQWKILREKLREVGLVLPADLSATSQDITDDIHQQIYITRFVSESIGSGAARAECEVQLEAKNFEIARLCDRLHYYETMNQEMSQRNQEAIVSLIWRKNPALLADHRPSSSPPQLFFLHGHPIKQRLSSSHVSVQ